MTIGLEKLAATLADWSEGTSAVIHLYGSRVRGDHQLDSDVDVHIEFINSTDKDVTWWTSQNDEDFASIKEKLPGRLEILDRNKSLAQTIVAAGKESLHRDRNVICVWLPPKP